jgi:glucose/arabinose dehydrogenase/mono/diheme cytochrome c family protein
MRCLVSLTVAVTALFAATAAGEVPFDTTRRVPWTGSRVVGSPEPPLPYRAVTAYPDLRMTNPIKVVAEPGTDRLLLIYQTLAWTGGGRIGAITDRADTNTLAPFLDLDGIAYGVAFHPDYARNGYLYVGMNGPHKGPPKFTKVVRYTVSRTAPFQPDPKSALTVIEWQSNGHNGGDLDFGPDGLMYITSGDGTSDSDTDVTGQDLTKLLAKVLRIDVDHPAPGQNYSVPKDNPFVGRAGTRPETWAYGFRNPWRISVDRPTGDVWVGNNGQDLYEQIYLVAKGANYGWSVMEGHHVFYKERKAGPEPFSGPIADHPHSEARSMTGGLVYRGKKFPELHGAYIYGDWSTGRIWGLRHEKGKVTWHKELARGSLQISGFGTDSQGELLICDHGGGRLCRLEPIPPEPNAPPFPKRLSETGLFTSVKDHTVAPGLIPYSVNAPLWSDGAAKERFIALPNKEQIDFTRTRGWNFPDGTVLVKTFTLPTAAGPRRIETRLLTRQGGEWAGYTYRWGDDQADAELVPAAGRDETFRVRDAAAPGGEHEQAWHYPSRVECMLCHSRAANWTLGTSALQMNRVHDYGNGVRLNQIEMLERLGVFKVAALDNVAKLRSMSHAVTAAERGFAGLTGVPATGGLSAALLGVMEPLEKAMRENPRTRDVLPQRPEKLTRLVDPADTTADLELRARSYLHANCANCHVPAGGGNALFSADFNAELAKSDLVGVAPQHFTFGIEGVKLVEPGHPEKSVLYQRVSRRGQHQMPPLASSVVDRAGVELLREWITTMKPPTKAEPKAKK